MRRLWPFLLSLITAVPATASDDIAWMKGDPQAAFDLAKKDGKPLFLYWGAVWCPPCNQIKKTIFTRREFVEKTKLFIPVYLDGDTASAQTWGEKLKISGYPTMLVMSPEGREIMRLPTGLQVEDFTAVLDEALGKMTPISEVLKATLAAKDPAKVSAQSYRLLAFYSWGQDESVNLTTAERVTRFKALEARVPASLKREKSRLFALSLASLLNQSDEMAAAKKSLSLSAAERKSLEARVREILADPELTVANLEFLESRAADTVKLLEPTAGDARQSLVAAWGKAMAGIEASDALSVDERLSSLLPSLDVLKLDGGDKPVVPAALKERIKAKVAWAEAEAKDAYTRQAAMSTAGYLLQQAGLNDEAKALYLNQLDKAPSPHYFMSDLAELAKEAGNKEEAISWYKKAYDGAQGRATRFQWGTSYLSGLLELAPQDATRIRDESLGVFKELLGYDDAFAGRNNMRVKRLEKRFREWNKDGSRAGEVTAIRTAMLPSSASLSDHPEEETKETLRGRCQGFFTSLGAAEAKK